MEIHGAQIFGFLCFIVKVYGQQTDCACYGNDITIDSLMPNCSSSDGIIVIDSIYRAAKPLTLGCSNPVSAGTRDEATCCTYDSAADCRIDLTSSDIPNVYSDCTGVATCSKQVTWQGSAPDCNATYMTQTNYMCMDYTCFPKSDFLEFCDTSGANVQTTPSYFFNDGYSSGISHVNCCACVITASDASATIGLDVIDLNLYDSTATCLQTVFVTDSSGVSSFNCSQNNDYVIKRLFTSTGNTLTVTLKSEAAAVGNGKAWFRASASSGGLTTSCSSVAQCPDETTTTPATGQESGNNTSSTSDSSADTGIFGLSLLISAIIIAASLLLILCTCIVFCVMCYKFGKSKSFKVTQVRSKDTGEALSNNKNRSRISQSNSSTQSGVRSSRPNVQSLRSDNRIPRGQQNSLVSTNTFSTGINAQRPSENWSNRNQHFQRTSLTRVESPW
ncbi:uncharacterized protein LOC132730663 [Ruditapes philippinarum]|uniref:uncharacterized protein LOC132730663 n=1 Tax=Ruditapes philippinarum TaxID=129788 RepID=UPI00295B9F34|nr:uncharacterized protein LOC132730663 [Ruditapes philippinarum]